MDHFDNKGKSEYQVSLLERKRLLVPDVGLKEPVQGPWIQGTIVKFLEQYQL